MSDSQPDDRPDKQPDSQGYIAAFEVALSAVRQAKDGEIAALRQQGDTLRDRVQLRPDDGPGALSDAMGYTILRLGAL